MLRYRAVRVERRGLSAVVGMALGASAIPGTYAEMPSEISKNAEDTYRDSTLSYSRVTAGHPDRRSPESSDDREAGCQLTTGQCGNDSPWSKC